MFKPEKGYYLPKDAAKVANLTVNLMIREDREVFNQRGGYIVERHLRDSLHRMGGIPYSAVGLWVYQTQVDSPRFILRSLHFMDEERSHDQTLQLSSFARKPLEEIRQIEVDGKKLVMPSGDNMLFGSFPELKLNHSVRPDNEHEEISPQYLADFQTIMNWRFGPNGSPSIGDLDKDWGKFLGGTIAFVDPMHPR